MKKFKFDLDDVYSSDNLTEDVISLIGTNGYFSRELSENPENWSIKRQLKRIMIDEKGMYFVADTLNTRYQYFLPEDKLKEVEEPKYRPFTLEEFLNKFSVGTKISYKKKDNSYSGYALFNGYYRKNDSKYTAIMIGNEDLRLYELCNEYEYLDEHGDWQPFGVQE